MEKKWETGREGANASFGSPDVAGREGWKRISIVEKYEQNFSPSLKILESSNFNNTESRNNKNRET